MAGRGRTADMAAAFHDDPAVTAGAQRAVAARVRNQSLRIPDLGVPVGNAGIEAADERACRDDWQFAVPAVPGRRPPRETWLDVTATRRRGQSLHPGGSDERGTSPPGRSRPVACSRGARV